VRVALIIALMLAAAATATPAGAETSIPPGHADAQRTDAVAESEAAAPVTFDGAATTGSDLVEHRREYALVAAIALLLAGAAIVFSLPPRH
jgi:hypothetical protein